MARILAFDFGLKRVGIAVTDPLQIIANSLETLSLKETYEFIKRYCATEEVEAFVVGYPFAHGHKENDIVKHIDRFIARLNQLYPDKKVHNLYGTWAEKQMYGRKYMGTLRTTFVINEKGIIDEVIEKVKSAEHASQILGEPVAATKKPVSSKVPARKKA